MITYSNENRFYELGTYYSRSTQIVPSVDLLSLFSLGIRQLRHECFPGLF